MNNQPDAGSFGSVKQDAGERSDDRRQDQSSSTGDASAGGCSNLHVCAIGASAGGLDPIQAFFAAVPPDLGVVYVVIQHLSPDHDSLMPQLAGRVTKMPVGLVPQTDDGHPVQMDHVYLIPPGKEMVIQNGRLFLSDRDEPKHLALSIDHFLLSLAQDQGRFSVSIVLSGTGDDGSAGILDIHRSGGLVMAQDPRTCKFDSMPERAIATGLCDVILPPAGLADALARYVRQSLSREQVDRLELHEKPGPVSFEILELLRQDTNLNFSIYKPKTVLRRIQRRQEMSGFDSLESYRDSLRDNPEQRETLLADLLIGVTNFYRNREAFDLLQHEAITKILASKKEGEEVRIWVAGCATGEEAYTIAFILDQAIARLDKQLRFKLFATDVNRAAIDIAAAGVFTEAAVQSLPAEIIGKYFVRHNQSYQVVSRIRKQLVFVKHDLMSDAPFTRMDLVSCRNLLIYLQSSAQAKVLSLFHFSLVAGGFLFLGSSESIGQLDEEFDAVNRTWRLYRKLRDVQLASNRAEAKRKAVNDAMSRPALDEDNRTFGFGPTPTVRTGPDRFQLTDGRLQQAYDSLLEKMLPAGFLIDRDGQLLHTFADGGDFLHMQAGRYSTYLVDLIHEDLRAALSAAVQHCRRDQKRVVYSGVSMGDPAEGTLRRMDLSVEPVTVDENGVTASIVTVSEVEGASRQTDHSTHVDVSTGQNDGVEALENELAFTRENLQATIEELESSNEELQAANEKMIASNEELQSTNEELQSVNEEMHTVNAEYHRKIGQLHAADDDMENLLRSSGVSVLFLDRELCIRRLTPSLELKSGLRPADIGRPITSFQTPFVPQEVIDLCQQVLDERAPVNLEIDNVEGRVYSVLITPFESKTVADGVVVNYVDATQIRQQEDTSRRWASIVESTADCIIAMDLAATITQWNPAAEQLYGWTTDEAIGKNYYDLVVPRDRRGETAMRIEQVRSECVPDQFDSVRETKSNQFVEVTARLSAVFGDDGIVGISSIERDLTPTRRRERLQAYEELVRANSYLQSASNEGLEELNKVTQDALESRCLWIWRVDAVTQELTADYSSFGPGENEWLRVNEIDLDTLARRSYQSRKAIHRRIKIAPPKTNPSAPGDATTDTEKWQQILKPLLLDGTCVGVIGVLVNLSSNQQLDEVLSTLKAVARTLAIQLHNEQRIEELLRVSDIVENASDFIGTCDASGRMVSLNRAGRLLTGIGLDEDVAGLRLRDLHTGESSDRITAEGVPEATRSGHWSGEVQLVDRRENRLTVSELVTAHRDQRGHLRYLSIIGRVQSDQGGVKRRLETLIRETQRDSDAKTTFLANVSHDVRTPMTSVIGLADLLLEENLTQRQRTMVSSIRDSGRFVTELLNDLLDLSKVESGKLTITPKPVDLAVLCDELKQAFSPIADRAGLKFELDSSGLPDVSVMLDPTRFRQIIENLFSNAIKFTDKGYVRVVTECQDDHLIAKVIDSGCGIENSVARTVFDPYTQESTPRRVRGAGLGLAISRKLAERMGGSLSLISESGQGSEFTLRIPLLLADDPDMDAASDEDEFPLGAGVLDGRRVLLAEDTRGIQFLIKSILAREGIEIEIVDNGRDAVDQIIQASENDQPFEALLLDMQMPIMDGYEAARLVRKSGQTLPIIAITASTMQEEQIASLQAGCDRFIPKPIDKITLLSTLRQLLQSV